MADRVLGWGILGAARITRSVIPPLLSSPRNRLVGVASRSREKAQALVDRHGSFKVYDSYQDLLADPSIDVVYNPLPNSLHAEWTIKAAQAGKHVLCEKPLAVTVAEVDAISEAARQAGVVVAEAFMYRSLPQTLRVQQLIQEGAIGAPRFVRGNYTFNLTRDPDVRLMPDLAGGSIWDVGCYPISYIRLILGDPVEAFGWATMGPTGVDVAFAGQLRFASQAGEGGKGGKASQAMAQFDCGFRVPYRTSVEIVGTEGILSVPSPFRAASTDAIRLLRLEQMQRTPPNDEPESISVPEQMPYLGEIEDMADAILLGRPPRVSLSDSRGNVATIVACLRSASEGRPVALEG